MTIFLRIGTPLCIVSGIAALRISLNCAKATMTSTTETTSLWNSGFIQTDPLPKFVGDST
jgi:hypothetical protein